jgi:hypothetical protein
MRRMLSGAGFLAGALLLVTAVLSTLPPTLVVKPDKESYAVGSSAHVEFFLAYGPNLVRGAVTIPSTSYEILISGPSGPVVAMRTYVHTQEPVIISPNSTQKVGEFYWDLKDAEGNSVVPGTYTIAVSLLDYPLSGETKIQVY